MALMVRLHVVSAWHWATGTPNTNSGAAKSNADLGACISPFFTVNTAKYSPKYFRICEYGPYLAFLLGDVSDIHHLEEGGGGSHVRFRCAPGVKQLGTRPRTGLFALSGLMAYGSR